MSVFLDSESIGVGEDTGTDEADSSSSSSHQENNFVWKIQVQQFFMYHHPHVHGDK